MGQGGLFPDRPKATITKPLIKKKKKSHFFLYFMCTLAETLTSSSSYFIMFLSAESLSGKNLVSGKPVVGSEETKTGVTQAVKTEGKKD